MGVVPGSSAHPTCGTPPRTSVRGGRLQVAALPQQQQLDAQPGGVRPSATSLSIERLQPVCLPDQHSAAQLQQLETGPGGQSGRRIHPRLGRGEGICLSLVLLDWVVFSEAGASGGTLPSNDHTPVVSAAMVSQTPSAGDSSAQATTDVSEPPLGSGPGAPSLGGDGAPASSRLAAVRHSFTGQRRSAQVVKLHLASSGRNTERAYASAFQVWASWGASLSSTIAEVLQFLSDHYGQGRQYWTVAGYRSVSQTLPPVEGLLVGQHPLVCRLLRGDIQPATPSPALPSHAGRTQGTRLALQVWSVSAVSPSATDKEDSHASRLDGSQSVLRGPSAGCGFIALLSRHCHLFSGGIGEESTAGSASEDVLPLPFRSTSI